MERVLKTWALVSLFIFLGMCMQVYMLMQCMYVGKHMCVNACDYTLAEDRKTVSILFCLPSSCPFEAESDEWSTASVILLLLTFHGPVVTGKCVHTQLFTKVNGVQTKVLMLTKQALLSTEPSLYSQELYIST